MHIRSNERNSTCKKQAIACYRKSQKKKSLFLFHRLEVHTFAHLKTHTHTRIHSANKKFQHNTIKLSFIYTHGTIISHQYRMNIT